jgi:hypothetical protein
MFSPGKLTSQSKTDVVLGGFSSHADFETACRYCHAPLETIQGDLCIRCHTTISDQIQNEIGTHARIKNIEQCRDCHPDHQGLDFDITQAAFFRFDHSLTRFSLQWHQLDYDMTPFDCSSCHDIENGFVLIDQICEVCHADENSEFIATHLQDFGEDCLSCHDGSGQMTNFDHAKTKFPLEGRHASASCGSCHIDGQFENISLQCAACHLEPPIHTGLFSNDCAACHTADNWSVMASMDGVIFDHFKQFGFSLVRHQTDFTGSLLKCAACHTSEDGLTAAFKMEYCTNCHTSKDPEFMAEHDIQFGTECLSCHDGIDRMAQFDHNRIFILDGKHAEISCESCHFDKVFSGTPTLCVECHVEPEIHVGYFGVQCENCHTAEAWAPAKMQAHTFPLDHGEEGLIPCEVCHVNRYTEYTCYGCHEHQPEEIIDKHQEEDISGPRLEDCAACHATGEEHEES